MDPMEEAAAEPPVQQRRLLSETLDPRLYNALRSQIIKNRLATPTRVQSPNLQGVVIPSNLQDVTQCIKDAINSLDYWRKIKRGMLLHLEWLKEKYDEEADETSNRSQDQSNSESYVPAERTSSSNKRRSRALRRRNRRLPKGKNCRGKVVVKKQPPRACNFKDQEEIQVKQDKRKQ